MSEHVYVGTELELFAQAKVWKSYLYRQIGPFLGSDVLEVGAGIGATTKAFCRLEHARWVCLEPDPQMAEQLRHAIDAGEMPPRCTAVIGTVADLSDEPSFDSVLYIDVLEHIEDDRGEVARVGAHLRRGGYLVVLSPAHQWLYTPFDKAIGHFRRYTRGSLAALTPPDLELVRLRYLDSAGMLASLGNRLVLNQSMPTPRQIAVWDNWFVRASTALDRVTAYRLGKSVLAVWRKRDGS